MKSRYIESEAEEDYEKDSFIASEDDSDAESLGSADGNEVHSASKKPLKAPSKKQRTADDDSDNAGVKVFSNKKLDLAAVPAKPLKSVNARPTHTKPYEFRLTFTNGTLLRKFLEPAAHAVQKMRITICHPKNAEQFTGFRIDCHDLAFTLIHRGMFEAMVESKDNVADGIHFCVNSDAIMDSLSSSTLKESDLCITRYSSSPDKICFESTNNMNDVRTVYQCALVDSNDDESMDNINIQLGFHVNVNMSTLKELCLNAKRCGAGNLKFELWQAPDNEDPLVIHSRMSIGFEGDKTTGSHDFFISTRKEVKGTDVSWVPLTSSVSLEVLDALKMVRKSSNEYDNKKLRLFLNHMESNWILVHLGTENDAYPLVLEINGGGSRTKHTVIVAPKEQGMN